MKNLIYIFFCSIFFVSCLGPIEDNKSLGNILSENELQLEVYNISPGSNKIVMINNTPQEGNYWDYIIGASTRKNDTILLPFLGTQSITFTAICQGGTVSTQRQVTIDKIDFPLDEMWNLLAGSDENGKTWVWATGNPDYYLYGNGGSEDTTPAWWQVDAGLMNDWGYLYDEMIFDLNGGANFTLIARGKDGASTPVITHDSFILDVDKQTVKTANGTPFIRNEDFTQGEFTIAKLTEDELTLIFYNAPEGANYIWMLKRKGYEYH